MEKKNPKNILIIEDDPDLVLGLNTLLNAQGYVTAAAYDSLYGINLTHKNKPDLIILDLGLPAGGGFFVLENLKKSVNTNNIPILILTAKQEKELEEKAFRMGVAAYIYKPFDPKELLEQIEHVLYQEGDKSK